MVKKSLVPIKKSISATPSKAAITLKKKVMTKAELEQSLIDNFINLQKVLTNLSIKFDDLSSNISKLLQLFEISAKTFAEKYSEGKEGKSDTALLNKLDSLLDQNKTIAKGIMLMEEKVRERAPPTRLIRNQSRVEDMFKPRPLPR